MIKTILAFLIALFLSQIVCGQNRDQPTDTLGWHIVKERESMQSITAQYLGVTWLWRENWELNPDIKDPHKIYPGQRIRVILQRELPPQSAQVTTVRRRVEHQATSEPWTTTIEGELLRENDGLRTYEKSSTELQFADGSMLKIGEQSLIFLQILKRDLVGVNRETVEIIKGMADIEAKPTDRRNTEIEIIMGGVRNRQVLDKRSTLVSRSRLGEQGRAEVMVFNGTAEVESEGAMVQVPEGMGTTVKPGEAPAAPTKLLNGPKLSYPSKNASFNYANPTFAWQEVEGAKAYRVSVFETTNNKRVLAATSLAKSAEWSPDHLPAGQLAWQVKAIGAQGLDGYSSSEIDFEVTSEERDMVPPTVTVTFAGYGHWDSSDSLVIDPTTEIVISATDDTSGVKSINYSWDGSTWHTYKEPFLASSNDVKQLYVRAEDMAKRQAEIKTVQIAVSPDPPPPLRLKRQ